MNPDRPLRSQRWFEAGGVPGLFHRAYLKSEGFSDQALGTARSSGSSTHGRSW